MKVTFGPLRNRFSFVGQKHLRLVRNLQYTHWLLTFLCCLSQIKYYCYQWALEDLKDKKEKASLNIYLMMLISIQFTIKKWFALKLVLKISATASSHDLLLHRTMMLTSAQVIKISATVTNNTPSQDYTLILTFKTI